jgi:uncharacterized membrane protein
MDTAPIDSYDGAAEIFTFGGGSFGMWLFLILAALLFVGLIVRMAVHETHAFSRMSEDEPGADESTSEPVRQAA